MNSEMIPKIHRRISLTKISSQAFKEARSPNVDLLILYFYLNLALCSLRIQQYYRKADAIILTFDCTERSSFYNIESWIQQINAKAQNDVLKIIVSNKIDITHRDITFEEGEKIAKDYNCTYFETSAKTGHNINALFQTVAESLLESDAYQARIKDDKDKIQRKLTLTTVDSKSCCYTMFGKGCWKS